jgi:hypothetical protein
MQGVTRSSRRPCHRAIGWLIGVIGPREIAAGVEPAHRSEEVLRLTGVLAHDVSIPPGVGRHLGSQPRAKTSITIMRAPQCGNLWPIAASLAPQLPRRVSEGNRTSRGGKENDANDPERNSPPHEALRQLLIDRRLRTRMTQMDVARKIGKAAELRFRGRVRIAEGVSD